LSSTIRGHRHVRDVVGGHGRSWIAERLVVFALAGVGRISTMPITTSPALPAGTFARLRQPVLDAGTALLRPWASVDVAAVVEAYDDPAIQQWHARTMSRVEAAAWIAHWSDRWAQEIGASWVVEVDGQVAGQVTLRSIDLHEACVEVSYWVLPWARGKGLATSAVGVVTQWAFGLGVHCAELNHSSGNDASCRVAMKAGYRAEGTAVQRGLHIDGWHDMHLHALVNASPGSES